MTLQLTNLKSIDPKKIYSFIINEISKIINDIKENSADDEGLSQAKKDAYKTLSKLYKNTNKELTELEKNADWNTFTVAFYGETNAGKSTLIETLRILLKEPNKVQSQNEFRKLQEKYDLSDKDVSDLQAEIEQAKVEFERLGLDLGVLRDSHGVEIAQIEAELAQELEQNLETSNEKLSSDKIRLQKQEELYDEANSKVYQLTSSLEEYKRTASFFKKLLGLFRFLVEHIKLRLAKKESKKIKKIRDQMLAEFEAEHPQSNLRQQRLNNQRRDLVSQFKEKEKSLLIQQIDKEIKQKDLLQQQNKLASELTKLTAQLEKYSDGDIIGDGRPDYTKFTVPYDFSFDGEKFRLLDVPGIEGKEGKVLSEITKAVQKAHAVFYIVNSAAPPQTGDGVNQGTLGKIKEHLGAQTEVWAIYNKKINTFRQALLERDLLSEGEKTGLEELNQKMREQLGSHYRDVISLTAKPAFLVSAEYLASGSQFSSARKKIIEVASVEEILEISGVSDFLNWFKTQLLDGSELKIRKSNFNKVSEQLKNISEGIGVLQLTFDELSKRVDMECKSAQSQLNSSFEGLKVRLKNNGENQIDIMIKEIRKKAYEKINEDIKNDELKTMLNETIASEQIKFKEKMDGFVKVDVRKFEKDAKDIFKRFQEHVQELAKAYSKFNTKGFQQKFDFKIKLDNGIKWPALIGSVGAIATAIAFPVALPWVIASLIVAALSFAKSVLGYFDSDYKKSQQRKATDKSLAEVKKVWYTNLDENLVDGFRDMEKHLELLKQELQQPKKQVLTLKKSFSNFSHELSLLTTQVKNAGEA